MVTGIIIDGHNKLFPGMNQNDQVMKCFHSELNFMHFAIITKLPSIVFENFYNNFTGYPREQ